MNDFDAEAVALGGKRAYFAGDYDKFAWHNLMRPQLDARAREALYAEALDKMSANLGKPFARRRGIQYDSSQMNRMAASAWPCQRRHGQAHERISQSVSTASELGE